MTAPSMGASGREVIVAIDLNDEIKMWGGFTGSELTLAGGVVLALFIVCVMLLGEMTGSLLVGVSAFGLTTGPWLVFVMYKRDLPKGYLMRRYRQEGKFLFLTFKNVRGVDLYAPPAVHRAQAWAEDFGDED